MKLIEVEIMYKSKESFHNKMLFLILYSIKSDMFSTFENIMTVMIEYFLELIDSRR